MFLVFSCVFHIHIALIRIVSYVHSRRRRQTDDQWYQRRTDELLDAIATKLSNQEFRQSRTEPAVQDAMRHLQSYAEGGLWTVEPSVLHQVARHIVLTGHTNAGRMVFQAQK